MKRVWLGITVVVMSLGIFACGKSETSSSNSNNETRQIVINDYETETETETMTVDLEEVANNNAEAVNLEDYDLFRYFDKTSAEVTELSGIEPETMDNGTQHFQLSKSVSLYTNNSEEHKVDYLNISAYDNVSAYHIGKYWIGMSREDIDKVSEEVGYHWISEESKIVRFSNDVHIIQFYLNNGSPARVTQMSLYWYE